MNDIVKEKGEMFTFVCGSCFSEAKFSLVIVYTSKVKFKKKEYAQFKKINRNLNYVYHENYFTTLRKDKFEEYFGKRIKIGEIRYGRLKLRLVKRKKK